MRQFGPAIVVLLLSIGCAVEKPRPPLPAPSSPASSTVVSDSNPPLSWSDSIQAAEAASIRAADGKVSRTGPELRVHLLDGRTAVFEDDTTEGGQFALFRYEGYLKALHSHVIHRVPYEGNGAYWILDDSSGDSTLVFGMPVPSPDGTRFALTSQAGNADYDPRLLEVWRMVDRKPEKEFSYEGDDVPWDPSDAVWRDSVTIDFVKNLNMEPYTRTPGRLTRVGTEWVLSDSTR
ncbi:MAG TPA: hypothetical protein VK481_08965 [Gemmatimonadaceae bacterium]|nr:hypothetical protein [Gemmatimonadaceae bacterium]